MKVLVIGYGSIGKRHAENLLKLGAQVNIVDPAYPTTLTLDEQLDRVDRVVIASPADTHFSYVRKVINRKLPLYVEKPLVRTQGSYDTVVESLAKMNYPYPIYVGYQMRCDSELQNLRENYTKFLERYHDRCPYPPLIYIRFGYDIRQWHPNNGYTERIGVLLEASHELDYLTHLFGTQVRVVGEPLLIGTEDQGPESIARFTLRTKFPGRYSGIEAHVIVDLDYTCPSYERWCWVRSPGLVQSWSFNKTVNEHSYYVAMDHFLNTSEEDSPLATFSEYRHVLQIVKEVRAATHYHEKIMEVRKTP